MGVDTRALNQEEALGFISLIEPDGGAKCSMRYWRRKRQVVSPPNRRIGLSRSRSRHQQQTTRLLRQPFGSFGEGDFGV